MSNSIFSRSQSLLSQQFWPKITKVFLTAASCPNKDFYTPPPQIKKNLCNRLLYCILKIARHLYCILKKVLKSRPKKVGKKLEKRQQKRWQKGIKRVGKNAAKKVGKKFIPEPVLLLS